jgi:hypothetical protein
MKFLIIDTDYPKFLRDFYSTEMLKNASYNFQMEERRDSQFGLAQFYSNNLKDIGYEALEIYANNEFMQKAWAKEHQLEIHNDTNIFKRWQINNNSFKGLFKRYPSWYYEILEAQIRFYKPEVLLIQAMSEIDCQFLQKIKKDVRLLVGQHSATKLKDSNEWRVYDLVVSSFPPTVEWFQKKGISSELHRLGFEPKVLSSIAANEKKYDVCFVGSIVKGIHDNRVPLLESICDRFENVCIWTPDIDNIERKSPIHRAYRGDIYGKSMFQIFHDSKIVINQHGNIPPYAANMRLYEVTGVGTLLITDWKSNLSEMFEIGKDVVAYRSQKECIDLISYYLSHNEERETIALSGNQRTLREHTYYHRMHELTKIIQKYL